MNTKHTMLIPTNTTPIIKVTQAGIEQECYVRLSRSSKFSHAIEKPKGYRKSITLEIGQDDTIHGIHQRGFQDINLTSILKRAGIKAPPEVINRAKYTIGKTEPDQEAW
jgi:hypothetical protein